MSIKPTECFIVTRLPHSSCSSESKRSASRCQVMEGTLILVFSWITIDLYTAKKIENIHNVIGLRYKHVTKYAWQFTVRFILRVSARALRLSTYKLVAQ